MCAPAPRRPKGGPAGCGGVSAASQHDGALEGAPVRAGETKTDADRGVHAT